MPTIIWLLGAGAAMGGPKWALKGFMNSKDPLATAPFALIS